MLRAFEQEEFQLSQKHKVNQCIRISTLSCKHKVNQSIKIDVFQYSYFFKLSQFSPYELQGFCPLNFLGFPKCTLLQDCCERVASMDSQDYYQRSTWMAASNQGGQASGGALFFCKSKLLHYAILSCSSSLKQYCNNQHKIVWENLSCYLNLCSVVRNRKLCYKLCQTIPQ